MPLLKIGYFFEDQAHERFIRTLVWKKLGIAGEEGLHEDTLCSRGGSRIITSFRKYIQKWRSQKGTKSLFHDLIIVVHDANCKGRENIRKQFVKIASKAAFPEHIICFAIPDPYIERWFLADTEVLRKAFHAQKSLAPLPYVHDKKRKSYYKDNLLSALNSIDIHPAQMGSEYGDLFAQHCDFDSIARADQGFNDFLDCLRRHESLLKRSS